MAANTVPLASIAGRTSWNSTPLTTANTATDGSGALTLIFTAGVNGSIVDRIRVRALGANVATVLRLFIGNGGDTSVGANTTLYAEMTVALTTLSQVAALLTTNEFPNTLDTTAFPIVLPAGYILYCTIGTSVAAGLQITAVGSDF